VDGDFIRLSVPADHAEVGEVGRGFGSGRRI
jgi:hypothetical protein